MNEILMGISIIICTHNGSRRIVRTLEHLKNQELTVDIPCEVLVVDNGSTDETGDVVRTFLTLNSFPVPLAIIQESNPGKANALTTGYDRARYELMLCCDDDNGFHPGYLKTVFDLFQSQPSIALAGGYGIACFGDEQKPDWFDKWQHHYACGKVYNKSGFLQEGESKIWGAGSVIRKSVWTRLVNEGFYFFSSNSSAKPLGEDVELAQAVIFAGGQLYFDERLWFWHSLSIERVTWPGLLEMCRINGSISALLLCRYIAFKAKSDTFPVYTRLIIPMIFRHVAGLIYQFTRKSNKPVITARTHFIISLICNFRKNYHFFRENFTWINNLKIHHSYEVSFH